MIRVILLFSLMLLSFACNRTPQKPEFTDDYVLIEFAARLEEDYHGTSAKPLESDAQPSIE